MAYIQFLGAAGVVTGSKHLINTGDLQVLVDCGLFQGQKEWRERNWQDPPIPVKEIDAVILTHAHLDHSGWIPRLVKQGFTGPIYCTAATRDLCGILLPDSGHLQEEDAAFHNKHKTSRHDPALPLYTMEEAQQALNNFQTVEFTQTKQLSPAFSFRFVPAAHIVGSSMVEITLKVNGTTRNLVFTGDIGRIRNEQVAPGRVIHHGPAEGERPDTLVMESTYGNRVHPKEDVRPLLAKVIHETIERGGSVVVPAFAVERTQKLLFMLKDMMNTGMLLRIPVFVDSPMAIQAVQIFLKHQEEFSEETRQLIKRCGSPLEWQGVTLAAKQEESRKINDVRYPCIIISSSGMITGGRILHHLIHRLSDPRNTVIFIGFQSPGTRGASIKAGAKTVRMFGEEVAVRAQIVAFEQFSDHADTAELLEWLATFKKVPDATFLVHGEPAAASALQAAISEKMGWHVEVAKWLEKVEIQ